MHKKFSGSLAAFSASAAVAAALAFGVAALPVSAAGLSESQIQSILSVLASFGADTSVTSNVNAALHGQQGTSSSGEGMHDGQGMMGGMGMMGHMGSSSTFNRPPRPMMGTTTMWSEDGHAPIGSSTSMGDGHGRPWGMGSTAGSTTCVSITATLAQGSTDATTGGQVKMLQQFLTQHLNLQDNIVTGFFGPKTAEHLKEFQAEQGLDKVGRVGGLTRAALAHMCGGLGNMMGQGDHGMGGGDHGMHDTTTASTSANH